MEKRRDQLFLLGVFHQQQRPGVFGYAGGSIKQRGDEEIAVILGDHPQKCRDDPCDNIEDQGCQPAAEFIGQHAAQYGPDYLRDQADGGDHADHRRRQADARHVNRYKRHKQAIGDAPHRLGIQARALVASQIFNGMPDRLVPLFHMKAPCPFPDCLCMRKFCLLKGISLLIVSFENHLYITASAGNVRPKPAGFGIWYRFACPTAPG